MSAAHSQPPAAGEAAHTPTGYRFFALNDRMLRLVRNSEEDSRLETHVCEIPMIYRDDAAFIVRACNSHAALVTALESHIHEMERQGWHKNIGGANVLHYREMIALRNSAKGVQS